MGLDAVTTDDADEAVAALQADPTGFRAVILDYLMPERTGPEVLRDLRRFSDVDVFLSSGFAPGELADLGVHEEFAGFLPKPYRFEEFRRLLERES
jgi:DNA-binding NtrC family response regulator